MFSLETRNDNLEKMTQNTLDVLVIGGGITGAGIVLDAVTRGLTVGLVEMRDFASGTSSRSTKLVHGGLRYLAQLDIKTVAEVGQEREIVYENAPHVTTPVKMMLPFYKGGTFGPFTTTIALDIYDRLAKVKKNERKFMLSPEESLRREPYLIEKGLSGTGVYVEYRTDDSRLTLEALKKANELGAMISNYTKVVKLLYRQETGQIIGVRVIDTVTGKEYPIYAKRVINATGPWVDQLRELDQSKEGKYLHMTKGVHVVVDQDKLPLSNAIYFDTPFNDGRMMFAIPRAGKVYIGTTDTFYEKNPAEPEIKREDVDYIIRATNAIFDIPKLKLSDVETAWAGVRPLIHEAGKSPSEISRRDEIFHSKSGLYSIAGGKLTGYRKMSETIMDKVLKDLSVNEGIPYIDCQTKELTLSGGVVGGSAAFNQLADRFIQMGQTHYNLAPAEAKEIVQRYGANAKVVFDYLLEENTTNLDDMTLAMLKYGLEHEMILDPVDFLLRRTSYLLFDIKHALEIKDDVILFMATYLNWTEEKVAVMMEELEVEINRHTVFPY